MHACTAHAHAQDKTKESHDKLKVAFKVFLESCNVESFSVKSLYLYMSTKNRSIVVDRSLFIYEHEDKFH